MKDILLAVIAIIVSALRAPREDTAKLSQVNKELEDLDLNDDQRAQVEEAVRLAAAARPPTEDQLNVAKNSLSGVGVSQDPAQPPGSPAPGNPEAEERMEENKKNPPEEDNEEHNETARQLEENNSKEELVKLASDEEVDVSSHATKSEIAKAIVKARKAK